MTKKNHRHSCSFRDLRDGVVRLAPILSPRRAPGVSRTHANAPVSSPKLCARNHPNHQGPSTCKFSCSSWAGPANLRPPADPLLAAAGFFAFLSEAPLPPPFMSREASAAGAAQTHNQAKSELDDLSCMFPCERVWRLSGSRCSIDKTFYCRKPRRKALGEYHARRAAESRMTPERGATFRISILCVRLTFTERYRWCSRPK